MSSIWIMDFINMKLNIIYLFGFKKNNMIKWDWFWKLLKQLFSFLLISCFILLGSSFVSAENYQLFPVWLDRYQSERNNQYWISVLNHSRFLSDYLWTTKNILALDNSKLIFRTPQGWLYLFYYLWYSTLDYVQWYFQYIQSCDTIDLSTSWDYIQNCWTPFAVWLNDEIVNNFINTLTSWDYVYIHDNPSSYSCWGYCTYHRLDIQVCFSSNSAWSTLCFLWDKSWYEYSSYASRYPFFSSIWLDSSTTFGSISRSNLSEPPWFISWQWDNWSDYWESIQYESISLDSDESAINYYESRYGWDSSICYVWTDSLNYLYWENWVSFQEWQWLTIFEVFNQLYWNIDLDKVYVWLNSRLINYEQWFDRDTPLYLSTYNSWTNQVDLYYDNLTFPFSNNPVAFFFMSDYIVNNSPYSSMGSSVVSYCNLKINSWTYEQILDQADKNNINNYTSQYNINYWYNSDWTVKQFTGAWLSSWVNIAFSWNTTVKNTLRNIFDKFNNLLSSISDWVWNWVLPNWLISAFLVVALFKLLRKR